MIGKNLFLRLSCDPPVRFRRSFFVVTKTTSSIQQKKDRWDRITGSRDNFFQVWIESKSSLDWIAKIWSESDPYETLLKTPLFYAIWPILAKITYKFYTNSNVSFIRDVRDPSENAISYFGYNFIIISYKSLFVISIITFT